jgi:NADH-quinone oxidoreductase subunit J
MCVELMLLAVNINLVAFSVFQGNIVGQVFAMLVLTVAAAEAAIGRVLYTQYFYLFQVAGLVLLVAMIGAIVLTLRHRPNVKRQRIAEQVARTKETAIEIRQVRPGQGLGA